MPTTEEFETDVVIVGGGPVAAVLLMLLARWGLRGIALEREGDVYHLARAVGFDGETVRVLQAIGLADAFPSLLRSSRGMTFQNEAGEILMDWSYAPEAIGPDGWAGQYTFHQPDLETLLRARIARTPGIELRTGQEVVAIDESSDGVIVTARRTDDDSNVLVRARWAVGADGASSITRPRIGATFERLGPSQAWAVVDMVVSEAAVTPEKSTQYCWPSRPHMYFRLAGPRRRWEFMVLPDDDESTMTEPGSVWRLLGDELDEGDGVIERAAVYRFRSMIADRWRSGRILLAGDSAHLQPPMLAQGLCSGIRDAVNLAEKFALIAAGRAGEELLDDYQAERAPHVAAWIAEATRLAQIVQTTDPESARQRDHELRSGERTLRSIRPRLGSVTDSDALVGTLCPQDVSPDGIRSDDAIGLRWAVFARPSLAEQVAEVRSDLEAGDRLIAPLQTGDAAMRILDLLDRDIVMMRPDRYIASTSLERFDQFLPRPEAVSRG